MKRKVLIPIIFIALFSLCFASVTEGYLMQKKSDNLSVDFSDVEEVADSKGVSFSEEDFSKMGAVFSDEELSEEFYAEAKNRKYSSGDEIYGIPGITLNFSNLDNSGNLIYVGIDFGVFADKSKNGNYSCVKVKRILTNSTNISIDLGKDYEKDINHKCAYRMLYVAVGPSQDEIIIANFNNGKEGWIPLEGSSFMPYFAKIEGMVTHTDKWEQNRNTFDIKNFNKTFSDEVTFSKYSNKSNPRERYQNVFWAGEKFMLSADVTGTAKKVIAKIYERDGSSWKDSGVSATLKKTSKKNGNATVYTGSLYEKGFQYRWGQKEPERLKIVFTATYEGDVVKTYEVEVIVDNSIKYEANHQKNN